MGAGMEVVDGTHARQSEGSWPHDERSWSTFRVRGDAQMTSNHTFMQVRSSW